MKGRFLVFASLVALGSGCWTKAAPRLPFPELRIERPASGSVMTQAAIDVVGTSNMPSVSLDGVSHAVAEGRFTIPVRLIDGTNRFTLHAGNGYTTTTMNLLVMFEQPTSSESSL